MRGAGHDHACSVLGRTRETCQEERRTRRTATANQTRLVV